MGFFDGLKKKDKHAKTGGFIPLGPSNRELKDEKERLTLKKEIRGLKTKKKSKLQVLREYNAKQRELILAREKHKTAKLEQRVSRQALKQQLPRYNRVAFGKPLSDTTVKKNTINKSRGGPLSDYKPKKILDSDKSADAFLSGKGGI